MCLVECDKEQHVEVLEDLGVTTMVHNCMVRVLHSQEAGAFHYETGCYTIAKESSSRRCDVCIVQSSYTSISLKV